MEVTERAREWIQIGDSQPPLSATVADLPREESLQRPGFALARGNAPTYAHAITTTSELIAALPQKG